MLRRVVTLVLIVILAFTAGAQADEVKAKSSGKNRMKTKKSVPVAQEELAAEEYYEAGLPAEFQELDSLSRDIKKTLIVLQRDTEKILAGMRSIAMRKSAVESEKQTIELLTVQGDAKKQSIENLSDEIRRLSAQVDDLAALYRQKDGEFRNLSAKLNELDIKRKGLSELHAVAGYFKKGDADKSALNLSANNEEVKSLNKRIDDMLSGVSAAKVTVGSATEESLIKPVVVSELRSTPKWVLDKIKEKGRKMETSYGDMVVARDGSSTIISIRKENDTRLRSSYKKLIKEIYESDGMEYFVLGSGS